MEDLDRKRITNVENSLKVVEKDVSILKTKMNKLTTNPVRKKIASWASQSNNNLRKTSEEKIFKPEQIQSSRPTTPSNSVHSDDDNEDNESKESKEEEIVEPITLKQSISADSIENLYNVERIKPVYDDLRVWMANPDPNRRNIFQKLNISGAARNIVFKRNNHKSMKGLAVAYFNGKDALNSALNQVADAVLYLFQHKKEVEEIGSNVLLNQTTKNNLLETSKLVKELLKICEKIVTDFIK